MDATLFSNKNQSLAKARDWFSSENNLVSIGTQGCMWWIRYDLQISSFLQWRNIFTLYLPIFQCNMLFRWLFSVFNCDLQPIRSHVAGHITITRASWRSHVAKILMSLGSWSRLNVFYSIGHWRNRFLHNRLCYTGWHSLFAAKISHSLKLMTDFRRKQRVSTNIPWMFV